MQGELKNIVHGWEAPSPATALCYEGEMDWGGILPCLQKTFVFSLMNSFIFRVSIFISALVTSKSLFPVSITPRSLVLYLQLPPKLQPPFPKLNIFPHPEQASIWSSLVLTTLLASPVSLAFSPDPISSAPLKCHWFVLFPNSSLSLFSDLFRMLNRLIFLKHFYYITAKKFSLRTYDSLLPL